MKEIGKRMISRLGLGTGFFLLMILTTGFAVTFETDRYVKIAKSIETFGNVYKEIAQNYVDEIDPEKFMRAGVDGMLATLDPYTVYLDEDEREQMDLITTGKYAGIGVSIGQRDGKVVIVGLMEGYSAQRQGLREGDRFLEINGMKVTGMRLDSVRALVRGEPGTEVHILIEREGERKPIDYVLVREEIQLKNVTYSGFVEPGIGYVKLERFTRTAGDEMRQALSSLIASGNLKGVILDLRDNPGGLLDQAVDIVDKFVPKGSLVVSTKGRRPEAERKYTATEDAMTNVPLVVLVNRNSASASEIVAGAIQDLDRGVIIGTRTFGKGLVQTVVPISAEGAELKLTTARYYTPSGRCIQEIDYMRKREGVVDTTAENLRKVFWTIHHRRVLEAGGIQPDSIVDGDSTNRYVRALLRKGMFFSFANRYVSQHKDLGKNFVFDSAIVDSFRTYLTRQKFDYDEESDMKLKELRDLAVDGKYSPEFSTHLDLLVRDLDKIKSKAFDKNREVIVGALKEELSGRYDGERGRIEASFTDDKQLKAGANVLRNTPEYSIILGLK